ncbi:acetyl-CoA carboxylase biotin carboxylase subunit [Pusillimonas minor]|nr:acetyl-CoA carboxylase biotin carboxylase subunit [Pusillimonas minor]
MMQADQAAVQGPIRRVLVANRGEIAVRVLRTLKRLGLESVLVASTADRDSMGAQLADRTVCIGPGRATDSYLKIDTIIQAALSTGAQAIHPGYGFLSERAEFAQACEDNNLVFIGPTAEQIERVGNKLEARLIAEKANVPITPGGPVASLDEALAVADTIGYPVLIKAVGGGGGRGLKRADDRDALVRLFELASAEALAAFGDGRVYIECFVTQGRHVEVQVLGDGQSVIHLGDRDCSVQRRYQKLVEEAPAPNLPDAMRAGLHAAAVRFAEYIGYRSAGTIEFLVDVQRDQFYFLEMNARIQVEHPVTELVTGIDLVQAQLAVAQGHALPWVQSDVRVNGHAIECRVNAEDSDRDFQPSPGRVNTAQFPQRAGIRVDTHMQAGAMIPPFYDSMIAKVIAYGATRDEARRALAAALNDTAIAGVKTNIALHLDVLNTPEFTEGGVDTGFLGRYLADRAAMAQEG